MGFTVSPSNGLKFKRQPLKEVFFTVNRQKCRVILRDFINFTVSTDLFRTSGSWKTSKLEKTTFLVLKNTFSTLNKTLKLDGEIAETSNLNSFLWFRINYSRHCECFDQSCVNRTECAWNHAFPVFISPIVWNTCENLHYQSVYFKELHNEQE